MIAVHAENLFRARAIAALAKQTTGRPICLLPRPWLWLNGLLIVLLLSAAVFLGSAEYSRKEAARGWLISKSGIARIVNNSAAVVSEVNPMPGDRVTTGEPLIYLSTDAILPGGHGKTEQVLTQLRGESREIDTQLELSREREALESTALARALHSFDKGVAALLARRDEQRRRVAMKQRKLGRIEQLVERGAATEWELLQQREEMSSLELALARLEQDIADQQRERELLQGRQGGAPVRAEIERSVLRARRRQLLQQIAAQETMRRSVLTAPVTGFIASVEVHAGDSIAPRQLLMTVLPEDMDLVAEIYVPSRAAGFIRSGQEVRISYDAFPQQKFGAFEGRIARISNVIVLPGDVPRPFPMREATYTVQVEIRDKAVITRIGRAALRPGMLLAAEIVLEKRTLVDWLLEPLRLRRSSTG